MKNLEPGDIKSNISNWEKAKTLQKYLIDKFDLCFPTRLDHPGIPDLMVYKLEEGEIVDFKIIQAKRPDEELQPNQKNWFRKHNDEVECYIAVVYEDEKPEVNLQFNQISRHSNESVEYNGMEIEEASLRGEDLEKQFEELQRIRDKFGEEEWNNLTQKDKADLTDASRPYLINEILEDVHKEYGTALGITDRYD